MKVLFMFGGLPHYYNKVLNYLNSINNLDISVVIPQKKSSTLGKGVHETTEDVGFNLFTLPEYKTYYRKTFFLGFKQLVVEKNYNAIVTSWPYVLGFIFYPKLLKIIRKKGIKLIYKDIPFQVPKFKEALQFKNIELWDENVIKKQLNFFNKLIFLSSVVLRKKIYSVVDAHVNYVEQAYDILESYGVNKEKIFITYNSPDTDSLFKEKKNIEEEPQQEYKKNRIIHIGRLVNWKRVDLILKAVRILKDKFSDIELLIIGTGPEESNLKKLAEELEVSNHIHFVGGVYDSLTLGRYLKSSSVYVLAGMGGLSINEAMAFGKPIICSVCDGTEKKLVREGYNGLYFKEGDSEDLAIKIESLLHDGKRITIMGVNSEKIIKNEVNIHTVVEGYVKAFNYVSDNKYSLTYNNNK